MILKVIAESKQSSPISSRVTGNHSTFTGPISIAAILDSSSSHYWKTGQRSRPKVPAAMHQYRLQWQLIPLAWTGRKGGILVPGHGTTRCQYKSIGTGWFRQPVPNDDGVKGTGSWHHPVPIVQVKAPGDATNRCRRMLHHYSPVGNMTRCP